jgi:hypothetical protein
MLGDWSPSPSRTEDLVPACCSRQDCGAGCVVDDLLIGEDPSYRMLEGGVVQAMGLVERDDEEGCPVPRSQLDSISFLVRDFYHLLVAP